MKSKKNILDLYFQYWKATSGLHYKFTHSQQSLASLYPKMNDNLLHERSIKQEK